MSLSKAIAVAQVAHAEQLDKGGQPFIGHPLRVMAALATRGVPEYVLEAAVLHDILEDTDTTEDDLLSFGISPEVVGIVEILTRTKQDKYFDYINRIKINPVATYIKLADIDDNLDPARKVEGLDLTDRYKKAVDILTGGPDEVEKS
jgi:(p)ppGpp synthase/HD superfamily hydrolase